MAFTEKLSYVLFLKKNWKTSNMLHHPAVYRNLVKSRQEEEVKEQLKRLGTK